MIHPTRLTAHYSWMPEKKLVSNSGKAQRMRKKQLKSLGGTLELHEDIVG